MDEMRDVRDFRNEVPDSSRRSLLPARDRLLDEARPTRGALGGVRRLRPPRLGIPQVATAGALSVALAGGLIAVQTVDFGGGAGDEGGPPPSTAQAAVILEKAADAARAEPAHGNGEFTYREWKSTIRTSRSAARGGEPDSYTARYHRMEWRSVDGSEAGLYRSKGSATGVDQPVVGGSTAADAHSGKWQQEEIPGEDGQPSLVDPTYRYLRSLPRDGDELLRKLRGICEQMNRPIVRQNVETRETTSVAAPPCDWASYSFDVVRSLVTDNVVPPKVRAGLFDAAAEIPGVTVVEDAELPATGEHGIAATLTNDGMRTELIFDPATFALLGSRTVTVADMKDPDTSRVTTQAGTVIESVAIVEKGFVDKVGQRP